MAGHGSPVFEAYSRNLRRIFWSEFVDAQLSAARPANFHASLVEDPLPEKDNLTKVFEYHRHRPSLVAAE